VFKTRGSRISTGAYTTSVASGVVSGVGKGGAGVWAETGDKISRYKTSGMIYIHRRKGGKVIEDFN
jgi:uncharacterized membrane protein YhiD involved in acid resistance